MLSLLAEPPVSLMLLAPKMAHHLRIKPINLRTSTCTMCPPGTSILESVQRTGRLVIVHEASCTAGVGAVIAAEIQSKAFFKLHVPVRRVTD